MLSLNFYNQFDHVIKNMVIRLLKSNSGDPGYEYKKEWMDRCEEDGVPKELFDTAKIGFNGLPRQFRTIKASRIAGDGSTLARIMGLESLQPIAGTFNAKEMASYKQDYVEATLGPDYVETYASSEDQPDEQDGGASLAGVENFMLQQGAKPVFSIDNEQEAHAGTHMALLTQTVQALQQQQMSPIDANKIFMVAIPHEQEHIGAMEKAPLLYRGTLQKLVPVFNQILKLAELNKKNAEAMIQAAQKKQQEDAAKTNQVMADVQRKDMVAQHDMQLSKEKQDAAIELHKQTAEQRGEIMRTSVEKDAENKRLKVQLDAQAKNATAKGRSETQLMDTSPDELAAQSSQIVGQTPSSVDFEKVPHGPMIGDLGKVPI